MRKLAYLILPLLLFFSIEGMTQETIFEEKTTVFKTENSYGIGMHTNGFHATYRYGKYITGFTKRMFEIDVANIKHPREKKSFFQFDEDIRGFFFGKLNSFIVVRPSIGYQKVIFPKQSVKGVSITYVAQIGPSLGFAKPIYLNIINREGNSDVITKEKFDPDIHNKGDVYSRSSFINGFAETRLYPGVFGRFGFSFDYGTSREIIRAVEVGVQLDAYFQRIPIIAFTQNRQLYPNFYLSMFFGTKNVD